MAIELTEFGERDVLRAALRCAIASDYLTLAATRKDKDPKRYASAKRESNLAVRCLGNAMSLAFDLEAHKYLGDLDRRIRAKPAAASKQRGKRKAGK